EYWPTGYLLAWDPASGRVVERYLLPDVPLALTVEQGTLRIALKRAGVVRLAGKRLERPVQLPCFGLARLSAIRSGRLLASNFIEWQPGRERLSFEVRQYFDPRLPLDLPELEKALRAAALRDPTQPWHPFFLGQVLWAQGRREEAE